MTSPELTQNVENLVPNSTASQQPMPKPKKKSNLWLIVIIGLLLLCICSLIGLVLAFPYISNYGSQRSLDYLIENVDEDWRPSLVQNRPFVPPVQSDDSSDLFVEQEGTLPFSSEFSSEIILRDRLLTPGDGFGSEFIAIGGNPHVFNFSVLKPLGWTRDLMTTQEYSYVDSVSNSRVGVLYFDPSSVGFTEYSSCKDTVSKLLGEPAEGVSLTFEGEEVKVIDGENWDRVEYVIRATDGEEELVINGLDQCYKDEYGMFVVYSIFRDTIDMKDEQISIMDDFIFRKVN